MTISTTFTAPYSGQYIFVRRAGSFTRADGGTGNANGSLAIGTSAGAQDVYFDNATAARLSRFGPLELETAVTLTGGVEYFVHAWSGGGSILHDPSYEFLPVNVFTDRAAIGFHTCGGAGTETITADLLDLDEGVHNISYTVEDEAGNQSAPSPSLEVTIAPDPPIDPTNAPDLQAGSDTGNSDSDDTTADFTPTFNVACSAAGDVITLHVDVPAANTVAGTHTCAGVGTEAATVSPGLLPGVYNVSYTVSNDGGESAASPALEVTIEADGAIDISVTKSSTGDFNASDDITYTIVVTNDGVGDAGEVNVTDIFPTGVTGVTWTCAASSAASSCTPSGTGDIDDDASVAAGDTVTYTATGTISAAATSLENTASATPLDRTVVAAFNTIDDEAAAGFVSTISNEHKFDAQEILPDDWEINGLEVDFVRLRVNNTNNATGFMGLNVGGVVSEPVPVGPGIQDLVFTFPAGSVVNIANGPNPAVTAGIVLAPTFPLNADGTGGTNNPMRASIQIQHVTPDDPNEVEGIGNTEWQVEAQFRGGSPIVESTVADLLLTADPTVAPDLQAGSDTGDADDDDVTSEVTPTFDVVCSAAGGVITLYTDFNSGTVSTVTGDNVGDGTSAGSSQQSAFNGAGGFTIPGLAGMIAAVPNGATWRVTTIELALNSSGQNNWILVNATQGVNSAGVDQAGNPDQGFPDFNFNGNFQPDPADQFTLSGVNTNAKRVQLFDNDGSFAEAAGLTGNPQVQVTMEISATVTAIGTHTCAGAGTESVTVDAPGLDDGVHNITYTNTVGTESAQSPALAVTVDTSAPAAPTNAPDLQPGSDTGDADDDDVTSDTTPSFDVACTEAGHVITIYSDSPAANTAVGTHTCAGTGAESVTVDAPGLDDGVHNITFTETDPAGNESGPSPALAITVDTTPLSVSPVAPDLQAASDTGAADDDDFTSASTPIFDAVCTQAGSTIVLYSDNPSGGTVVGTHTCVGTGAESVTVVAPGLVDGVHNVTFTETDAAGNCIADDPQSLTNLSAWTRTGNVQLLGGRLAYNGGGSAPNGVAVSELVKAFGPVDIDFVVRPNGSGGAPRLLVELLDGAGNVLDSADTISNVTLSGTAPGCIQLRVTDVSTGNLSSRDAWLDGVTVDGGDFPSLEVTVDSQGPAAPGSAPDLQAASDTGAADDDDLTSETTPTFDVVCTEAGATITLYANGAVAGTHTCAGVGTESATVDAPGLDDGVHNITFTETDVSGNESAPSAALEIEIDTEGPATAVTVTEPGDGETIATPTPTVVGTGGEPGGEVVVTGPNGETCTAPVAADGSWSCEIAPGLPEGGPSVITVTPVDPAGNEGPETTFETTVDTTAPVAPVGAPDLQAGSDTGAADDDDVTSETTPTFDVVCTEAGATITLYSDNPADGTVIGTHTCEGAGTESAAVDAPGLDDGVHNITFTETDPSGNESAPSPALEIEIDTEGPATTPTVTEPGDGETIATPTPTVVGTGGEPGGTVVVTGPNGEECVAPVAADGSWSCEIAPGLPEGGPSVITVTPVDPAGNEGTPTTIETTVDTTVPTPGQAPDLQPASDTGESNSDDITAETTPTFDVVCSEAGATITLLSDNPVPGTVIGEHTCELGGLESVTIDAPGLDDGVHNITYTETDALGNESETSEPFELVIDTEAPVTPEVGEPGDGETITTPTPVITGTGGEPGTTVIVTGPNGEECVAPVAADGSWSCELAPGLPEGGPSVITATPVDPAGNEGEPVTFEVTVDTDPDSDGDGVVDSEETSRRGGDGNGDGVADADQRSVASVANLAGDDFHTLGSVGATCTDITELALVSEDAANPDPNFSYPVGLFNFTVECENSGEAATVTIFFDDQYDTADWQWRKFDRNDNSYNNVAGVTFGTATVDGSTVTTATFSLADGGLLDEDGVLNASITDPSGPGVAAFSEVPPALAFTGRTMFATVVSALGLVLAGLVLWFTSRRRDDELANIS